MTSKHQMLKANGLIRQKYLGRVFLSPTKQYGQAMPLGIAFIMVGMLGAFVLFNTGQVAVNKQRLSDASDSAAYSGMVWQARALNFQAYTNRAMIANDVTIGQAVSLASWGTYGAISTENIATATAIIPVINTLTETLKNVFRTVNTIVNPISDAIVSAVGIVNVVVGGAQEAMFLSAFIATPDIVDKVADASDEEFTASSGYTVAGTALNLRDWNGFTEKYSQNDLDAMSERTDLIGESRDRYATDRQWKFFDKIWFFYTPFVHYRLYYDGQTRLMMSADESGTPNWEWVAKDGLSMHIKTYSFFGKDRKEEPIGWATAYANSAGGAKRSTANCRDYKTYGVEGCENFLDRNPEAEDLADRGRTSILGQASTPAGLTGYRGVQAFRSLSQSVLNDSEDSGDPVIRLRTEISMDVNKSESSNDWVHDSEPFATELNSPGNKLSSISIGEVYYRHPKGYRTSNSTIAFQRANGYNPYWDVRLAPVEIEERLVALTLRGDLPGSGSSTPGAEQLATYADGSGGAINFDLGGNVSGLGEYVGTLASAMELDDRLGETLENNAISLLSERTGLDENDVNFFKDKANLRVIEDELKVAVEAEIDTAKNQLLASITGGLISSSGRITGIDVQGAINSADQIIDEATEITERMEAMRDQVVADFQTALAREVVGYEAELDRLFGQLNPLLIELESLEEEILNFDHRGDGPIAQLSAVQNRVDSLRENIDYARIDLSNTITDAVMASINRHGGEFFSDGVTADIRRFFERDIHPMIDEYVQLSDEQRLAHVSGSVFPWDNEEEEEDQEDDYDDGSYGTFED